jgi:hypothetical protein
MCATTSSVSALMKAELWVDELTKALHDNKAAASGRIDQGAQLSLFPRTTRQDRCHDCMWPRSGLGGEMLDTPCTFI